MVLGAVQVPARRPARRVPRRPPDDRRLPGAGRGARRRPVAVRPAPARGPGRVQDRLTNSAEASTSSKPISTLMETMKSLVSPFWVTIRCLVRGTASAARAGWPPWWPGPSRWPRCSRCTNVPHCQTSVLSSSGHRERRLRRHGPVGRDRQRLEDGAAHRLDRVLPLGEPLRRHHLLLEVDLAGRGVDRELAEEHAERRASARRDVVAEGLDPVAARASRPPGRPSSGSSASSTGSVW